MSDVVIVGAKRTAIGSLLGQFTGVPDAHARRHRDQGRARARRRRRRPGRRSDHGLRAAGRPRPGARAPGRARRRPAASAGCTTINKVCGSGMKAIMLGHDAIKAGSANVVVAGGMESMTNAPHLLNSSRTGIRYGSAEMLDHMAWDGLTNPYDKQAMGVFGEMCVRQVRLHRASSRTRSPTEIGAARARPRMAAAPSRTRSRRSRSPAARATSWSTPTSSRASATSPRSRR